MISRLAPLLPHMVPGDVTGHGSYDWMMSSLPVALQADWGLELIGMMIKYPIAVEVFVQMCCSLEPSYSAEQLVDVLMETVVRVVARHDQDHVRCRGANAGLGCAGRVPFSGLTAHHAESGNLAEVSTCGGGSFEPPVPGPRAWEGWQATNTPARRKSD